MFPSSPAKLRKIDATMKQCVRSPVAILTVYLLAGAHGADSAVETIPLHAAASDRVSARPELLITTPGSIIGTERKTSDIWLRLEFDMPEAAARELRLIMNHDEDAEVYLNGVLAVKAPGHIGDYQEFEVTADGAKALRPGRNLLAVHCHQTTGGQYIDVGLVELVPLK